MTMIHLADNASSPVRSAEDDLLAAALEYDNAFSSTDPKKMSDRREAAHRALCRAARLYGQQAAKKAAAPKSDGVPCAPAPGGRRCATHDLLPLFASGLCSAGRA